MAIETTLITPGKSGEIHSDHANHLFPVFLKLEEMNVLLVGAGNVGLEKLTAIIHNAPGTHVLVVAEFISPEIILLAADYPNITLLQKTFDAEDLVGMQVIIIAVNDKDLSAVIRDEAKRKNVLVNAADMPDICDFYLGSVVQKGNVKIAISTN